jgi:type VI secretion system secreted protein Hcp
MNAYLRLSGQKQGKITGSSMTKGREGTIEVIGASHGLLSPRDPATGLPTGKRQHRPLTITKELDRSTPMLRQALVFNETLTSFELSFYMTSIKTHAEAQYFTIKLTNASIASIDMTMPNNRHADLASLETSEDVTFTYQKIEWDWLDPSITAYDDWQAPIA